MTEVADFKAITDAQLILLNANDGIDASWSKKPRAGCLKSC